MNKNCMRCVNCKNCIECIDCENVIDGIRLIGLKFNTPTKIKDDLGFRGIPRKPKWYMYVNSFFTGRRICFFTGKITS